jgi:membrane protein
VFRLFHITVLRWHRDRCMEMGAALSYYFLFSLFPVLLTIVGVVGFLLGPESHASQRILELAGSSLPPRAYTVIAVHLRHLNEQSLGAGFLGLILMLLSASTVFGVLDRSVDLIWRVREEPLGEGLSGTIASIAARKAIAFGAVMGTAALFVLSIGFGIAERFLRQYSEAVPSLPLPLGGDRLTIGEGLHHGSSILLVFLAVAMLLYFLPSTAVTIRDLLPGAGLATVVLTVLQQLIRRNILQLGAGFRSYGAIGSVMVLMLWVFIVFQVFLFACELSYTYAHLFGSRKHHKLII